jgi:DMSO/TMAO reductase YedYZ molybdopterin-dependent catalytic subunit
MASEFERVLLLRRRQFLVMLPLVGVLGPGVFANKQASPADSLDKGQLSPSQLLLTSNTDFYVRNHNGTGRLEASAWKLSFSGAVRNPFEITLHDLLSLPRRILTATLECAGNPVGGGMVGTATWAGVQLGRLLEKADPLPGVSIVRLVGGDQAINARNSSVPTNGFTRSIPIAKAKDPDTLLAYQMNGEPLPVKHGYPLRAVVPGWYGMDSVKWLVRVVALKREDVNFYSGAEYVAGRLAVVGADWQPVTRMQIKSAIIKPQTGDVLPLASYQITGMAWAGDTKVASVEVSTDAGQSWRQADIQTEPKPYTWLIWSYSWQPRTRESYTILARATDSKGNRQPATADPLRIDDYEQNWYQSVQCEVR